MIRCTLVLIMFIDTVVIVLFSDIVKQEDRLRNSAVSQY